MKHTIVLFSIILLTVFSTSCATEEGLGGNSTIEGNVFLVIHSSNNYQLTTDTVPASKADIFIEYGENKFYGDDIKAGFDGYFRFDYLQPGNYTIYAYNNHPDGGRERVAKSISLEKKSTATLPNIYIHEGKTFGKSLVKGKILAKMYKGGILQYADPKPAVEHRVYIRKATDTMHFDDIRASYDGSFIFEKLDIGSYVVFTTQEDKSTKLVTTVEYPIEVTQTEKLFELEDFIITLTL